MSDDHTISVGIPLTLHRADTHLVELGHTVARLAAALDTIAHMAETTTQPEKTVPLIAQLARAALVVRVGPTLGPSDGEP